MNKTNREKPLIRAFFVLLCTERAKSYVIKIHPQNTVVDYRHYPAFYINVLGFL